MHLIYLLLIALAVLLVLAIGLMTWPIWLFLLGAFLLLGIVGEKTAPWAKAARSLLLPTFYALVVLFFALLFINFSPPEPSEPVIRGTERFLLRVSDALKWTRLSWLAFTVLILVLISISAWAPRWRLPSRYLFLRDALSRLAIGVGVVASFTFFTNTGVLAPQEEKINAHISALMRHSVDREQQTIGTYLAYKSLAHFADSLDSVEKDYVAALVTAVAQTPRLNDAGRQELIAYFADRDYNAPSGTPASPRSLSPEGASGRRGLAALSARRAVETRAATFAGEASRGMKELLTQSLGLASEELADLAWGYFDRIRVLEQGYFTAAATNYLGEGVESAVEGRVDRFTEQAQSRLRSRFTAKGPATAALVRREVATVLRDLYARRLREALASSSAAETAAIAADQAVKADDLERADREVLIATREAEKAEAASKFVTAGEEALDAREVAEISRRVRAELGVTAVAVSSGDDALRSAIVAKRALAAAQQARTAAQSLRAARAARAGGWLVKLL
jgi:hypothetical protein